MLSRPLFWELNVHTGIGTQNGRQRKIGDVHCGMCLTFIYLFDNNRLLCVMKLKHWLLIWYVDISCLQVCLGVIDSLLVSTEFFGSVCEAVDVIASPENSTLQVRVAAFLPFILCHVVAKGSSSLDPSFVWAKLHRAASAEGKLLKDTGHYW